MKCPRPKIGCFRRPCKLLLIWKKITVLLEGGDPSFGRGSNEGRRQQDFRRWRNHSRCASQNL